MVKIEGRKAMAAACCTTVEEGMVVSAFDDEIEGYRKITLELLLAEHNYDCGICASNGECELQDLAFRYNLGNDYDKKRTIPTIWKDVRMPVDTSSPVLVYDATRCIKCGRCVAACDEVQEKQVLGFLHRGFGTFISPEMGMWSKSSCDGCGECVQACPTAGLTERPIVERFRSFEVDRHVRTTCVYCGVGCQLDLWIKGGRIVRVRGVDTEPNRGRLCVKGRFGYQFIENPDRLTTPLIRRDGELVEASWDEALELVARRFGEIRDKNSSSALAGLSSAKCTNEENYVFQRFIRATLGTNSVDHCARLCHAPTVAGLGRAFGSGAMTNSIPELADADCILVTGSNVTETHPVTSTYIKNAVRKGAKLIIIDPRRIDLVSKSTIWLRQKSGSDVAWINGMLNVIIEEGLADRTFIDSRTEGFEELKTLVASYTPERVEEISGIPAEKLREAARIFAGSERSSIIYAMGITQHITGTDNVLSLANLAMAAGQIGRRSTGVNPLRGQNNVQGACDVGALPDVYPGYMKVNLPEAAEKFQAAWGVEKLSLEPGLTVTEIMNGALDGSVKGLYIMGENPMLSDPNLRHVEEALEAIDFLVVQDIFMSETARYADVVLPAASFAEKEGTFTNSGRSVQRVRAAVPAPGLARADWEIICDLSNRMGSPMNYSGASAIMDEIASVSTIYGGISHARLDKEEIHWPCPSADHPGTLFLHGESFKRGKGKFHPVDWIPPAELADKIYPFVLSTGRMLYHYHTATMTRRSVPLNSFAPEAYVEIHPEDLKELGGSDGCRVKVTSRRGTIDIFARASGKVDRKVVFIPFHFHESPANMLTNDVLDPVSKIPELKVSACRIEVTD
jgi:formate dehydrogenase alpha subunit